MLPLNNGQSLQRRFLLTDIRAQAEKLFTEIESNLGIIEENRVIQEHLEEFDHVLRDREEKLKKYEDQLNVLSEQQDREREYIAQEVKKLEGREVLEKRIEDARMKLVTQQTVSERASEKADEALKLLAKKTEEYEDLERREQKLQEEQKLLLQREALERKRKEQNDLDAQANQAERERLQRIAESFQRARK